MCPEVSTWAEAGLNEEKMMRLVNMHWKPVYVNCGPCKQRSEVFRDKWMDVIRVIPFIMMTYHNAIHEA